MFSDLIFERTLGQLEMNLTVALVVTSPLTSFDVAEPLDAAIELMKRHDFSQAPVTRDEVVVGVLERDTRPGGPTVEDAMTSLTSDLIVPSHSSLRSVVQVLAGDGYRYRFVVSDCGVDGIVTRSDLHKLPVRLLAFCLVTHLETLMASFIDLQCPDDQWISYLEDMSKPLPEDVLRVIKRSIGENGLKVLERRRCLQSDADTSPTLLEMSDFVHKWYVAWKILNEDASFAEDMCRIQTQLRNSIMHTKDYVTDDTNLDTFAANLELTEQYIYRFTQLTKHKRSIRGLPDPQDEVAEALVIGRAD